MTTHILELTHDELSIATVLVKVALQRRAVRLIVAVRATNTDVRTASNRPRSTGAVDYRTVCGQEGREVGTHAEDLRGGIDELRDGCDAVVWEVVVVGQCVETWAFAASVAGSRCYKLRKSVRSPRTGGFSERTA